MAFTFCPRTKKTASAGGCVRGIAIGGQTSPSRIDAAAAPRFQINIVYRDRYLLCSANKTMTLCPAWYAKLADTSLKQIPCLSSSINRVYGVGATRRHVRQFSS
jgi:hypothetical protein